MTQLTAGKPEPLGAEVQAERGSISPSFPLTPSG